MGSITGPAAARRHERSLKRAGRRWKHASAVCADPDVGCYASRGGGHGVRGSTLARVDKAVETSFEMWGALWDIADDRAVSRDNGTWAMVAYVPGTWPLLRDVPWHGGVLHGQWDGSAVQVAIGCPLCGEQHHHAGSLDGGRCYGHRGSQVTQIVPGGGWRSLTPRIDCICLLCCRGCCVGARLLSRWHAAGSACGFPG